MAHQSFHGESMDSGNETGGDSRALRRVLDTLLDGIVVLSSSGQVQEINAEACRILETSAESGKNRTLDTMVGEQHPISRLAATVQKSREPVLCDEQPLRRRFGSPIQIEVAVSPLPDEDGGDPGVVILMRDRTIGNTLRQAVSQREELTRYGHIAAGIAHEVKNPLGGIRGAGELLRGWATDDRARGAAEMIVREVDRISALVDELMVFARGDEIDCAAMNLHQLIDHVIALLESDPLALNVDFQRLFDPSIPELIGDAARLTQVFLNLSRNSIQAMGEMGGTLTVTTRMTLTHRLVDASGRAVPTVEVMFEDDGPGIPAEILDRLATPFFTTKTNGTGLGLAVSRHWVTRHGGRLEIDRDLARGARVNLYLPLDTSASEAGNHMQPTS